MQPIALDRQLARTYFESRNCKKNSRERRGEYRDGAARRAFYERPKVSWRLMIPAAH
jgi:hypothetical protein